MLSKFDEYKILIFIGMMTVLAGMTNVIAIIYWQIPLTHHTGNLSQISIQLFENPSHFLKLLRIVCVYCLGSYICGFFQVSTSSKDKSHGYLLILSALMLIGLTLLNFHQYLYYLMSLIAGIQNAINIPFNGIRIRMTHMTGYLSDLGQLVAHWKNGSQSEKDKILLISLSLICFVCGGILGYKITHLKDIALYLLSSFYLSTGYYYLKYIANHDILSPSATSGTPTTLSE